MKLKLRLLSVLGLFLIAFVPAQAKAFDLFCPVKDASGNCTTGACKGLAANGPVCTDNQKQLTAANNPNPIGGPNGIIHKVADIFALVAGIASVIIIIYSGFVFVTAGGAIGGQRAGDNPTRAKNARGALIGALVGLAIVALAWTITTFVTNNFIHT